MQFLLPVTFAAPVPPGGADAPSPYDPVDAVRAMARGLCATGGSWSWRTSVRRPAQHSCRTRACLSRLRPTSLHCPHQPGRPAGWQCEGGGVVLSQGSPTSLSSRQAYLGTYTVRRTVPTPSTLVQGIRIQPVAGRGGSYRGTFRRCRTGLRDPSPTMGSQPFPPTRPQDETCRTRRR
jgi:hypothetical protein